MNSTQRFEDKYCPICLHKCDVSPKGFYSHWHSCEYEEHAEMPALNHIQMLEEKIKRLQLDIKVRRRALRFQLALKEQTLSKLNDIKKDQV